MKNPEMMLVSELWEQLSVALAHDEGAVMRRRLDSDRYSRAAAEKLVRCLHGDPELHQVLEQIPD